MFVFSVRVWIPFRVFPFWGLHHQPLQARHRLLPPILIHQSACDVSLTWPFLIRWLRIALWLWTMSCSLKISRETTMPLLVQPVSCLQCLSSTCTFTCTQRNGSPDNALFGEFSRCCENLANVMYHTACDIHHLLFTPCHAIFKMGYRAPNDRLSHRACHYWRRPPRHL